MNVLIIYEETLDLVRRELSDCEVFTGYSNRCYKQIPSSIEKIILAGLNNDPRSEMIRSIESFDHFKFIYIQVSDNPLLYRWFIIAVFKDTTGALLAKLSI